MLGAQFHVRTSSGFWVLKDECNNAISLIKNSSGYLSFQLGVKKNLSLHCGGANGGGSGGGRKSILISCKSSRGSSSDGGRSTNAFDDNDHDFLQASLLVSETLLHYRMHKQGFQGDMRLQFPVKWNPFKELKPDISSIGHEFLRRFQSPTIFLKVSCDGDFLLPILVGEFAIEKLIDTFKGGDDNEDCPDQFQFLRNMVERLGYEVKMVRITERISNTYYARVYFSKPGEDEILSVDARPSDAINVANRCQAPIHISKQIIFTDAIRMSYGGRVRDKKPNYDVSLDSPADGPDSLSEELHLLRNMNLAVEQEKYDDAAMWRDKLMELRQSKLDH